LKERDGLEDIGIVGRIILKLILKKDYGKFDSVYLTQNRD
jgi:hypothetical protein